MNTRYSDDQLLDSLGQVIEALGIITLSQYVAYRKENPGLPDPSVIRARLGGWEEAVRCAQKRRLSQEGAGRYRLNSPSLPDELRQQIDGIKRRSAGLAARLVASLSPAQLDLYQVVQDARTDVARRESLLQYLNGRKQSFQGPSDEALPAVTDPEAARIIQLLRQENASLAQKLVQAHRAMGSMPPKKALSLIDAEALLDEGEVQTQAPLLLKPNTDPARVRELELLRAQEKEELARQREQLRREQQNVRRKKRSSMLLHFQSRLFERYGIDLPYGRVDQLDCEARGVGIMTYMGNGAPIKVLDIDGAKVLALLTEDSEGRLTLTTVYTQAMLESNEFYAGV